jgi:hypothetical protein
VVTTTSFLLLSILRKSWLSLCSYSFWDLVCFCVTPCCCNTMLWQRTDTWNTHLLILVELINSMEQSPVRETDPASQEIHGVLWNTQFHYCLSGLSRINQVHALSSCFINVRFSVFPSTFSSTIRPFLSGFPFKPVLLFHFSSYNTKLLLLFYRHNLSSSVQQFYSFSFCFEVSRWCYFPFDI